ncbi:unnamed protein product [Sphagnum jensenii]|uniref:Potassium transporter n=1 Tax=Sphagnum jensenii TaxID=128206 RepID=A0ABP1BL00_9BRYO
MGSDIEGPPSSPSSLVSHKMKRADSLDVEAMCIPDIAQHEQKGMSNKLILQLAFQSIGVVYGDLGTSPLYVFSSTFYHGSISNTDDVLGALSLIIYTMILIPLVKYVFIVLQANDNGEGGTFALYSLICRHARVSPSHRQQHEWPAAHDSAPTTLTIGSDTRRGIRAAYIKEQIENSSFWQNVLLLTVLIGTCLVIGDGCLTPAISVLSAIEGIIVEAARIPQYVAILLTVVVLMAIFSVQKFGTGKVGFMFAPVVSIWFLSIAAIGIYNIFKYNATIFRALNPLYIVAYFQRNKKDAWISLGGIVLCITGTEAMFADLGHFTMKSIQIAFTALVFPSLLAAYMGQAAFLMKNHTDLDAQYTFYRSIPRAVYWPMFVVATAAAVVASQAMISATFSMIRSAMALGCFPRVTVIHTSRKYHGQIYIPEINWLLMVLSICIVAGFRSTNDIGNAYGIAVVGVFFISTCLLTLIMVMIWQKHILICLGFFVIWGTVEGVYFSSVLSKVDQGGWVPLAIASSFLLVMYAWHYGTELKYLFEVQHTIPMDWILGLGSSLGMARVPGIGLVYTQLPQGVPAIFAHFITNLPAIHSILVFVCVRNLPVSSVAPEDRILIRRVGPRQYRMYRCAVRYGYIDDVGHGCDENFGDLLVESLARFIRTEAGVSGTCISNVREVDEMGDGARGISSRTLGDDEDSLNAEQELAYLYEARAAAGIVYLLGYSEVHCKQDTSFLKKLLVNVYSYLRRNCRTSELYLRIPHSRLLKVGMTYYV